MAKMVVHVPTCHSTNAIAEQILAEEGTQEGTVVITDDQTDGKGQMDNVWVSEPGKNLTFSLILNPTFLPIESQFYLSIVVSLAIRESLTNWVGDNVKIKWPNDIMISNKKVAGILIKNTLNKKTVKSTIVGVGVNVNQDVFPVDTAISLKNILKKELDLVQVFENLLLSLDKYYLKLRNRKFHLLKTNYIESMFWLNEWHEFKKGERFKGRILGVDERGHLKVESEDQVLLFNNLDIKYCL